MTITQIASELPTSTSYKGENDAFLRERLILMLETGDERGAEGIISFALESHKENDSELLFQALIIIWKFVHVPFAKAQLSHLAAELFPVGTIEPLPQLKACQRDVWSLLAAALCNLGNQVFRNAFADAFIDVDNPGNRRLTDALGILRSNRGLVASVSRGRQEMD